MMFGQTWLWELRQVAPKHVDRKPQGVRQSVERLRNWPLCARFLGLRQGVTGVGITTKPVLKNLTHRVS